MDKKFKKEIEVQSPVLSQEALQSTLFIRKGTLPILLTVLHDGSLDSVDGIPFIRQPDSRPRDAGVSYPAREIVDRISTLSGERPNLVIQLVHRAFITPQIQAYFEKQAIDIVTELSVLSQSKKREYVLLFDLHGFTHQPLFGEFDLILGTGHRQTVRGIDIDYDFSDWMKRKGYCVYTPTEIPIKDERYSATNPTTLVQRLRQVHLNNVVGMQIEIARRFRRKDVNSIKKGKQLSQDIAEFLVHWCNQEIIL